MEDEAEDPVIMEHKDVSYSYAYQKPSHVPPALQINPEVDEIFRGDSAKSPDRGVKASFSEDVPLRIFESSDFKERNHMEAPEGRCNLERAILIDGNIDTILKCLPHEVGVDQNYNKILETCNVRPHPNVLQILGVLHENDKITLVSVCHEGNVRDWAKEQKHDPQECSSVAIQMGEGLKHLHLCKIIHRDVALRNFLINLMMGINIKICDFEMGKILTDKMHYRFDRNKEKLPWQCSPVEALKWGTHTTESDVYSFGIALWELFKRGEEPFATRTRAWITSDLENNVSAAQILDMDGIPSKMKLLIECCTVRVKEKRPTMDDVVTYLKQCGAEQFKMESIPKYFEKVINKKKRYSNPGEIGYEDLEMKYEMSDLPHLERAEHANSKADAKHVGESSPVVADNPAMRSDVQQQDSEVKSFFIILVKPQTAVQYGNVDTYVRMCNYLGMYHESDLHEYLADTDVSDLISDMFILKAFYSRKIPKLLFKDDPELKAAVTKKMKKLAKYNNEHPEKLRECEARLKDFSPPDSEAGKIILANNIRGEIANAGIRTRPAGFVDGSIIVKLLMTSDNLTRFKEQLQDDRSILRTHGTFFPTAELIRDGIFRDEPTNSPKIDGAFTFLEFLSSEEQRDCAALLFNYGIYNDRDIIELFSDANVEELESMKFPGSSMLIASQWVENQNPEAPSNTRPDEKKMQVLKRQKERDPDLYKTLEPEYGYQELGNIEGKPHTVLEGPRKTLVLSFNRYNKTLQLIEECYKNGAMERDQVNLERPTQAYITAKEHLEKPSKEDFVAPKEFESIISELNKFSTNAAQFVVSRKHLLKDLAQFKDLHGLHEDLQRPLEAQLWWIASFGEQTRISWEALFNALVDYMATVCNYPLTKDHRLFKEMQLSLRSCFGTIESGEDWRRLRKEIHSTISMTDFKKFYQRFGPWENIFCKSLPLCDSDGRPEHYFCPTESRKEGEKHLKEQDLGHIIRFSSRPGKFVYQGKGSNILIDNTPEGFKARGFCGRDIPGLIFQIWQNEEEPQAQMWRVTLQHINETGSKTYYDFAPPSSGRTYGKLAEADEAKYPVDSPGDQLVTAIRQLDSSKPRLFVVLPRNMPEFPDALLFETNWLLIVICEGNHLVERGDEIHLRPHFTKHEDLDIQFPESGIKDTLPYVRAGVEFLSRAIKENVIDTTSHSDAIMRYLGKDNGTKSITESLDAFQKTLSEILERYDVPDAAAFVGEDYQDYQALRKKVFGEWLKHDALQENVQIRMVEAGNAGEHTWVCEDHLQGRIAPTPQAGKVVDVRVEENTKTLIDMGFDINDIRLALKAAGGDLPSAIGRLI